MQWHPTPVLLPGKSHECRSLVGCSPWGRYESDTTEWLRFYFSLSHIGIGNGNPLQCSCLENPRDWGAYRLPSMGSHRVGHDWSDLAAAAACIILGFPGGTSGKELACQCRRDKRRGSIPGWGSFPGGGHGHPLQYSCLKNPMDRGAWQATVHGVAKSQTWLKQLSAHIHVYSFKLLTFDFSFLKFKKIRKHSFGQNIYT